LCKTKVKRTYAATVMVVAARRAKMRNPERFFIQEGRVDLHYRQIQLFNVDEETMRERW
jgi:hypothetical protein